MLVQIYEIQSPREAEKCISLGVDHLGSVLLSEKEWRQPLIREVIRLTEGTEAKSSLIPLFHREDTLFRSLEYYNPHFVHFCDSLTDDRCSAVDLDNLLSLQSHIIERFPRVRIIRSIPVPPEGMALHLPILPLARALEPVSDLFLIDTWLGKEPVEGYIGITGREVDRKRAAKLVRESRIPVILAGGLSPENAYDALMEVKPAGADSCTHTNALDSTGRPIRFRKDFKKVKRFVREVRRAEKALLMDRPALVSA
jgi:phosphoribosylanthranilate isomerase